MLKKYIRKIVMEVIDVAFAEKREEVKQEVESALHDVTYRIGVLRETGKRGEQRIHTSDFNTATHMFDGYVITNNSPTAGSVAWSDLNITYKGTTYAIKNGNTPKKYIWWKFSATDKTTLQMDDAKPTLTADDILIGINDGGTFNSMMTAGKMVHGASLADSTIGTNELGANAVTSTILANNAVIGGKIADNAVTETKLGSGAVTNAKLGANAVDSAKLADNAVTVNKIGAGAVSDTKLADNAVTVNKINAGAVTTVKLGANAVDATKLADNAVTVNKILNGAISELKLADKAVTGAKIGAGAVAEDKLNVATHFIF